MKKHVLCLTLFLFMSSGVQALHEASYTKSNSWATAIEKLLSPLFQELMPADEVTSWISWASGLVKKVASTISE